MERQVLSNGLIVYYYPIEHAYSTTFGLYINAGLINELPEQNGITHLLEHMHFRRLADLTQKQLYAKMDKIGAELRAKTYKDLLQYYIKIRPYFYNTVVDIFEKIMTMYEWNEEDLEDEKRVVLNEIYTKHNPWSISSASERFIWEGCSLSMPILGTEDTIFQISLEDVVKYKRTIFSEKNVALVVTGIITEGMKNEISYRLGKITLTKNKIESNHKKIDKCEKNGTNIKFIDCDGDYIDAEMSFKICAEEDPSLLVVLNSILGGGTGAKLQLLVREKLGLTYDIYSYTEEFSCASVIHISFSTHEKDLLRCVDAIITVLNDIKENITDEDMDMNIPYFTDALWFLLEDTQEINTVTGFNAFYKESPLTIEERISNNQKISKLQLMELAKRLFVNDKMYFLTVGAVKNTTKKKLKNISIN